MIFRAFLAHFLTTAVLACCVGAGIAAPKTAAKPAAAEPPLDMTAMLNAQIKRDAQRDPAASLQAALPLPDAPSTARSPAAASSRSSARSHTNTGMAITRQSRPNFSSRNPGTASECWRSNQGGGYDESMRSAEGLGAAGPPPGNPAGSVLNFGRYAGWSLGEIARRDIEYIEWLDRIPIGRPYREEIDVILRRVGRRKSVEAEAADRRGLFRRR